MNYLKRYKKNESELDYLVQSVKIVSWDIGLWSLGHHNVQFAL